MASPSNRKPKCPEAPQKDAKAETIHTTRKHPFLTVERGFLPANALKPGMHVIEANGHIGVITKWVVVAGQAMMYNLTVAYDHTYAVGVGQWVVHNAKCTLPDKYGGHIFRDAEGHFLEDTPENRQALIDTASDPANHLGVDPRGNEWSAKTLPDGRQLWTSVRNGEIRNGGINTVPRQWNPISGLRRPGRP